jgi:DNA modification methylase
LDRIAFTVAAPESFEALLGDDRPMMVFADPPYNVKIDKNVSGLGRVRHREFAEASGEMTPAEFTAILRIIFRNRARFSVEGSIHYQCMDWRHMREMLDAADGVYHEYKQLIVWAKDNASMGAFYRSQHELIFVFKTGKAKHINNFGLGDKGRYRTNVRTYAGANSFRKARAQDLADHPTVKPQALVADAILDCSNRGDVILDPFSGSGTTLIAAHRTKRRGAAIEVDPLYVDTSLRRLVAASGLTPMHADGRTFDAVAAERDAEARTAIVGGPSMSDPKEPYDVGYGKPPKATQFQPGQSGNKRGCPKGAKGLGAELKEELDEFVTITVDGKTRRVRKRRLVIKALAAKAAKGHVEKNDEAGSARFFTH